MVAEGNARRPGFRYQQLAVELEEQIRDGIFKVGERLPSLRELHNRTGYSITTVSHAYMELEDNGLVEPRERSGFFVQSFNKVLLPLPQPEEQQAAVRPRKIAKNPLATSILSAIRDPEMVPFGAALPANRLLPVRQLAQSARAVAGKYFKDGGLQYDTDCGVASLKRQIAARSIGFGERDADEIIITNGCLDAILLCLRAVTKPGDIVIVESPTFSCYLQLIRKMGLLALEIPTCPTLGINISSLEEVLQDGVWRRGRVAACLLNPSFQNPLGFTMPIERKKQLVEILVGHGIPLIEDDVYGELSFGGGRPAPLKSFDTSGLVLYCSSFSKTVAPDFRVGWILAGRFRDKIVHLQFNSSIAQSKLPQLILADFLESRRYERHLRNMRTAISNQVRSTTKAVARYFPENSRMTAPAGGYLLWVELAENVDSVELFHLARKEKIFIIPGIVAGSSGKFKNCIRISCGEPWSEKLDDGMKKLGLLVRSLQFR